MNFKPEIIQFFEALKQLFISIWSLFMGMAETEWVALGVLLTFIIYLHRRYIDYKSYAIVISNSLSKAENFITNLTSSGFHMFDISQSREKVNDIRKTAIVVFKFSEWFDNKEKILEFFSETEAEDLDEYFLLIQKIKFSAEKILIIEEEQQLQKGREYQRLFGDFCLNEEYFQWKDNKMEFDQKLAEPHQHRMLMYLNRPEIFHLNVYLVNLKEHLLQLNNKKIQPQIISKISFLAKTNFLCFMIHAALKFFNTGKLK